MRTALFLAALLLAPPALAGPPTIVVFFSDDHSRLDSSVYGARDLRTPNMQRLADDGLTFNRAFVASPACAPSRAALLTGLMPARNGAEENHSYCRDDIQTLPAYLHELGYEVAAFGKVCHGADVERRGFNHTDKSHAAARVAKYLDQRTSEKPLCLLVGTHSPHVPWPEGSGYRPGEVNIPQTHVDTPATRMMRCRYYEDVTRADTELGELRTLVDERFGENVLFAYTSDHGAQWPFGKWNLYDEGTRVPLIVAWPGVVAPGTRTDAMVSWIDLLPTLAEVAGGTPPAEGNPVGIDGRSFGAVLRGEADHLRDRVFTTHSGDGRMNVYPIRSVRTDRWKLIENLHPEFAYTTHIDLAQGKDGLLYWRPWVERAKTDPHAADAVRRYHQRPRWEFYDLDADPLEEHNLADRPEHAERIGGLKSELKAWMTAQGDRETVFREPRLLANPADWAPAPLEAPPAGAQNRPAAARKRQTAGR
ncbi:Choline-sulfatase [Pirellulimonas nuda]|uniref:Choline-sulfatase n=1 Tax=Pirellulimonas nuda TaxID=2528009 RepID=A0A518DIB2_9BACT|nr:sulfatase [Pirellulimonas nuda]QDU91216.1 Choline-sulfatase [Pirellulimonas nuda]